MTSILAKVIAFGIPLLLLVLTGIAGYAFSQIRALSLPIPQALALFTLVLPLITGISTRGAYGLIRRSSGSQQQYHLTIPLIAVIGFQLIYETVVSTLALTYIIPPSSLTCGLETRWQHLYANKDTRAIKVIQEAFNCCGFHNVKDRAWPWGTSQPSTCGNVYGRTNGCLGEWRKAEQTNAGLFLLVAVVVFVIKALSILSLLTNTPWSEFDWAQAFKQSNRDSEETPGDENGSSSRRLIEAATPDEEYHDEPPGSDAAPVAANENGQDQGPRVQPSQLLDHGNEWRHEGGA